MCHSCKKRGHLASIVVPRSRTREQLFSAKHHPEGSNLKLNGWKSKIDTLGYSEPELPIHKVEHSSTHPITVEVITNDAITAMSNK